MNAKRHSTKIRKQGMTLIELMIALALVSLLVSGVSVGLTGWTSAQLRSAARKVNSAFRYAYTRSITQGMITRVTFNMDTGEVSVEESDQQVLIAANSKELGQPAAQDPWEVAKKRLEEPLEELKIWSDPFRPIAMSGGGKSAPFTLGDNIKILRMQTSARPEIQDKGKESVYFFQNGMSEHAVVQIGDKAERVYTIEVLPITGRTKLYNHAYEPDDMKSSSFMEVRE